MAPCFRLLLKLSFVAILISIAGVCRADDYAPEPPPQFDKGWNLVSVPCDISIADFKRDMKEDTLKVYGWNGAEYEETKSLERGRGYFINVNSVLNPSSVCKPKAANEDMKVVFKPGWNLIGNPYHKAVSFTQLLGDAAGGEDAGIFELKGDKVVAVKASANVKPWAGYWLYSPVDVVMPIVNVRKLEIKAFKDAKLSDAAGNPAEVLKGGALYFYAMVKAREGFGSYETEVVTADAAFGVSEGAVGAFSAGGAFAAGDAAGSATVTASFDGLVSNGVAVNIVDVKVLKVQVRAFKDAGRKQESEYPAVALKGGELYFSATVTTQRGSAKSETSDVTEAATWTVSSDELGAMAGGGKFTAGSATGSMTVSAEYSGVVSNAVSVYVVDKPPVDCDYLIVALGKEEIYASYYTSNAFTDYSSNEYTCFHYDRDDSYSYSYGYSYGDEWATCFVLPLYGGDIVYGLGESVSIKAYCATEKHDYGDGYKSNYYTNITDVTSSVVWKVKDESIISRNVDGTYTAKAVGIPEISAVYGYKESEKFHFRILEKKKSLQGITASADYDKSSGLVSCININGNTGCGGGDYLIGKEKTGQLKAYGNYEVTLSDGGKEIESQNYSSSYGGSGYSVEDITAKVKWDSSDAGKAEVAPGGMLTAKSSGMATVTAALDGVTSNGLKIKVYDSDILYISIEPANEIKVMPGKTATFKVYAWYMNDASACSSYGSYSYYYGKCLRSEDITGLATVSLSDTSLGTAAGGLFTSGGKEGSAALTAEYKGLKSNAVNIIVKTKIWMVLTIGSYDAASLPNCPSATCFFARKGGKIRMMVMGREEAIFRAAGQDITSMATWEISDSSIATINAGGELTGKSKGIVWIRATVGDARSEKVPVAVVEDNFEFVIAGAGAYSFKPLKPLKAGDSYSFNAVYYKYHATASSNYKCGYTYGASNWECSNVYDATWNTSDSAIAKFSAGYNGYVTGVSPGFVDVTATYKGLTSNKSTFEVWDQREMKFCDDGDKNTGVWSETYTKATLETNCKSYNEADSVYIRYTAELADTQYLDNCLDLYIMDDEDNIVRTLREEGCTTEKITGRSSARTMTPVYQNLTKWDMLDDAGNKVGPGRYYAVARFYILWEPVIRLPFDIVGK